MSGMRSPRHAGHWLVSSAVPSVAVFGVALSACGSKDELPASRARQAASVSAATSVGAPTNVAKRITRDDCRAWASHGAEVFATSFDNASKNCTAELRKNVVDSYVSTQSVVRDAAYSTCIAKVDTIYQSGDATCFMNAKTGRALADCRFAPMTNAEDSDWPGMVEEIQQKCSPRPAPSASTPSL